MRGVIRHRSAASLLAGITMGLALGLALSGRSAHAQANYRLKPVGGRSQLLGGTGLSYGRDAAAAFLNPANAILIDDARLSFSVNFYTITLDYAPRWYRSGPIDRSKFGDLAVNDATFSNLSFSALPSSLCFFFRMDQIPFLTIKPESNGRASEGRLGLCFAQVESDETNIASEGYSTSNGGGSVVSRQSQTLAQRFTRFAVGPTYAMQVTNRIAFGMSLHGSLANHRNLMAVGATTYGTPITGGPINSIFYTSSHGDAFQLEAIVGATYQYGHQRFGVSIKSPSVHIYGKGGVNEQSHFEGGAGVGSGTSVVTADGSFVSRSPLRVGIGSGFDGGWGQAEIDMTYSTPLGEAFSAELEGHTLDTTPAAFSDRPVTLNISQPTRGVLNMAAGAELFVSPSISILSGISSDMSAISKGALRQGLFNYFPERTHRLAGTFGIGSRGVGGELLLGGEFSIGFGERLAVNSYQLPPTISPTPTSEYQLMFVIAGSTSIRNIRRAVEDVRKVLIEPAPAPVPGHEQQQKPQKP